MELLDYDEVEGFIWKHKIIRETIWQASISPLMTSGVFCA
jgi:hypothetical protein